LPHVLAGDLCPVRHRWTCWITRHVERIFHQDERDLAPDTARWLACVHGRVDDAAFARRG
jgi:hypothetical protein